MNQNAIFSAVGEILKKELGERDIRLDALTKNQKTHIQKAVTDAVSAPEFLAQLKGEKGADAVVDYGVLSDILTTNKEFLESIKGEKGDTPELLVDDIVSKLVPHIPAPLKGKDGLDGIGIKAIEQHEDDTSFDIVLDNEQTIAVNLPAPLKGETGETGEKGDDGVDRPLVDVRKASEGLDANEIVYHNGGLYQSTKKTIGTPDDDASAYRLILNGVEKAELRPNNDERTLEFVIRKTDGELQVVTAPMAPSYVDPEHTAKLLKGDYYIEGTKLKQWDGEAWDIRELRKTGRTGKNGVGVKSAEIHNEMLRLTMTDSKHYDLPIVEKVMELLVTEYKELLIDLAVPVPEDISEEIRRYAGIWQSDKKYSKGDVVTTYQGLYLALKKTKEPTGIRDDWAFMLGVQTSGGGGGSGGGLPIVPASLAPVVKKIVLNAGQSAGVLAKWVDARGDMAIVQTLADLNDRAVLPVGNLTSGKLVFVKDDNRLYEWLLTNNTLRTDTINDWRAINAAGPKVYNRVSDLPQPGGIVHVHDGDLAIVNFHSDGATPLNSIFMARKYGTATLPRPSAGDRVKEDGSTLTATGITDPNAGNYSMHVTVDPELDLTGGFPLTVATQQKLFVQYTDGKTDEITLAAGTYTNLADFLANGYTTTIGSSVPIAVYALDLASDGHTYLGIEAPMSAPAFMYRGTTPVTGSTNPQPPVFPNSYIWMPTARDAFKVALKSDPDIPDGKERDLQITTENGHKVIKMWLNPTQQWLTIYDEDLVKQWIAAGNLFTGTVQEAGHGTIGATDSASMPAESALGANDKGHYYVWVGSAGHQLGAAEIGGAVSSIDGQVVNVGDWIQVSEPTAGNYAYTVIPGDLLSRATAQSLFGLNNWVQGAYAQGTQVVHNGDIYKAATAILATDPAPDDPASTGWTKVPISGGVRTVQTDGDLPTSAANNAVYFVVSSGQAGNKPAMFMWDQPAGKWNQIGGANSVALDLTGGTIVYPSNHYQDAATSVALTAGANGTPTPYIIGDTLYRKDRDGAPILAAISKDGTTWTKALASSPATFPATRQIQTGEWRQNDGGKGVRIHGMGLAKGGHAKFWIGLDVGATFSGTHMIDGKRYIADYDGGHHQRGGEPLARVDSGGIAWVPLEWDSTWRGHVDMTFDWSVSAALFTDCIGLCAEVVARTTSTSYPFKLGCIYKIKTVNNLNSVCFASGTGGDGGQSEIVTFSGFKGEF